jgi:GTPase SAR1 family protein
MEGNNSFKKYEKIMIFGDSDVGKTSIIRRLGKKKLEFTKEKTKDSI